VGTWLPCPDTPVPVPPFYAETAELESPRCDQFVISISPDHNMPMIGTFGAGQTV